MIKPQIISIKSAIEITGKIISFFPLLFIACRALSPRATMHLKQIINSPQERLITSEGSFEYVRAIISTILI